MSLKQLFLMCGAICTAVVLTGFSSCDAEEFSEMLDPEAVGDAAKPLEYIVSIHQIIQYRRADMLEVEIPSYTGENVFINKNYYLHSKDIAKIDMVERKTDPGFYDLVLTLTPRGQKMWIGLSVDNRKKKLAFVIDRMYYRSFSPRMLLDTDETTVTLDGPFDVATAKALVKNSERNYKKLNK